MAAAPTSPGLCELKLEDCIVWQHPFENTKIYVPTDVVHYLSSASLRSLKHNPSSEIGGFLFGRKDSREDGSRLLIVRPRIVPSEGPLFNTTAGDSPNLTAALNEGSSADGLSLLGYFRSHVREGLYLSREDQDFIQQHMRDPDAMFLVIRPFDIGICMAGFFFWEEGHLQTEASDLEVPFVSGQDPITSTSDDYKTARVLSAPAIPTVSPLDKRDNPQYTRTVPERSRPRIPGASRKRPYLLIISTAVVLGLTASAGTIAYLAMPILRSHLETIASYTASTRLGLQVIRIGDRQINLSWNGNSPVLANRSGKLAITDGQLYRELTLDNSQLRSGKLAYLPDGSDVQFRLEVYLDGGRSIAESVRVLSPQLRTTNSDQTPTASPSVPAPTSSSQTSGAPPKAAQRETVTIPTPIRAKSKELIHFEPPRAVALQARDRLRQLPSAPEIIYDGARAYEVDRSFAPFLLPALPSWPALAASPVRLAASKERATSPAPENRPAASLATPITSSASRANLPIDIKPVESASTYVPPSPIKQVVPDVRRFGSIAPYRLTEVEVNLHIDTSGRVTDAHVARTRKKASSLLTNAALAAARDWVFKPAMMHNKAIAADHTVVFVFRPPTDTR